MDNGITPEQMSRPEGVLHKVDILTVKVPIENGRSVATIVKIADFRPEPGSEPGKTPPVVIYLPGFGQSRQKKLTELEKALFDEAEKNGQLVISADIKSMFPPPDKTGESGFSGEAKLLVQVLNQVNYAYRRRQQHQNNLASNTSFGIGIPGIEGSPKRLRREIDWLHGVVIAGYSEGSAIAIALAEKLDQLQQDAVAGSKIQELPVNVLRLWSLLGSVELSGKSWQIPARFTKESLTIAAIEIHGRLLSILSQNPLFMPVLQKFISPAHIHQLIAEYPRFLTKLGLSEYSNWQEAITVIKEQPKTLIALEPELLALLARKVLGEVVGPKDLGRLMGRLIQTVSSKKGIKELTTQVTAVGREGSLRMLINVFAKSFDSLPSLKGHLSKMMFRHPACNTLGGNWHVKIALPRYDQLAGLEDVIPAICERETGTVIRKSMLLQLRNVLDKITQKKLERPETIRENKSVEPGDLAKILFPKAQVDFTVIGEPEKPIGDQDRDLLSTHIGPATNPTLYLAAT